MPVIDGVFVPRSPLAIAEQHVDFAGHDAHVVEQRWKVERSCEPAVRRLVVLLDAFHGLMPMSVADQIAEKLRDGLDRTATFGFREAQKEIRSLRAGRAVKAYAVPDAGEYADLARGGLPSIRLLIRRRSQEVAHAVTAAVTQAAAVPGQDAVTRTLALAAAARRALHNNVLELVGETLNMGRTAGAMAMPQPPEFAMRSEQLDKATCDPCTRLHGEIAQLGSSEYFSLLPPADCLGGGRCRGLMIFGDGPMDVRQPVDLAA